MHHLHHSPALVLTLSPALASVKPLFVILCGLCETRAITAHDSCTKKRLCSCLKRHPSQHTCPLTLVSLSSAFSLYSNLSHVLLEVLSTPAAFFPLMAHKSVPIDSASDQCPQPALWAQLCVSVVVHRLCMGQQGPLQARPPAIATFSKPKNCR